MDLKRSWIEPDQFPDLRRLMDTALQANRRPIRLRCSESADG